MIPITLACGSYDRTLPIVDGRVAVEGVALNAITLPVEEVFYRMAVYREFDVAEMSLSSYALSLERDAPFMAIPVFPSRSFRHNGIFVRTGGGIESPADLAGRVVGIPEYQMTAAVWIRGMLAEHYGVPVDSVRYRTGGLHAAGRPEKIAIAPRGVDVRPIGPHDTLAGLLLDGKIDAIYTPRVPQPFVDGDPRIQRLWSDPAVAEKQYFRDTGIFPIMHTVVIRRDVYEQNRWLARSLVKAFTAAKNLAVGGLTETAALSTSLPFGYSEAAETVALMGRDFWPYGIEANRTTIDTLLRYSHEQDLLQTPRTADELFAPETSTSFVV